MLNKYSMFRNGSIAVITMFGTYTFFGVENVMLAFPIALTSAVLGRQNYGIKIYNKTLTLLIVNIAIVLTAHLSTLNQYMGIIINFIAIFLIVYAITMPYDATYYKPFVMLYVFTQYSIVESGRLPLRILSVVFGVLTVFLCNRLVSKVNEKNILGTSIIKSLDLIKEGLNEILKGNHSKEIENKCSDIMRRLAYKIYVSRYKNYLTSNLGKIQFEVFISIEYLNIYLKEVYEKFLSNDIKENQIKDIIEIIDFLKVGCREVSELEKVEACLFNFQEKYKNESNEMREVLNIIFDIIKSIKDLSKLKKRDINKIYDKWERSRYDKVKYTFKENFNLNSMRFKFAMRMAISLTIALFVGKLLGFYKIIWAIITMMSVIQPYYEDTIKKGKERVVGNVIAIILVGTIITIVDNEIITILLLVASLYLLYVYKEYYKISFFAATASLSIASLSKDINVLLGYRIIYVIIGVLLVFLVNKYLMPYRVEDGIKQLKEKIVSYESIILEQYNNIENDNINEHIVRDIVINQILLCEKLNIRNKQYGNEEIDKFINEKSNFVIEKAYLILDNI